MASTLAIAQLCARWRRRAQPRHVPLIITSAVVLSCLAVLLLDWGFSQLYVRLDDTHLAVAPDASAMYRDPTSAGVVSDDGSLGSSDGDAERAEYEEYYAATGAVDGGIGMDDSEADPLQDDLLSEDDVDADGDHEEL